MNNTNCLVSSDNVGLASIQFESLMNPGSLPGTGDFIGAFASSNLGDVSPNTKGPICIDTGEECDFVTSTCNGDAKNCIAFGPGDNMVESTEIIATKLFEKGKVKIGRDWWTCIDCTFRSCSSKMGLRSRDRLNTSTSTWTCRLKRPQLRWMTVPSRRYVVPHWG